MIRTDKRCVLHNIIMFIYHDMGYLVIRMTLFARVHVNTTFCSGVRVLAEETAMDLVMMSRPGCQAHVRPAVGSRLGECLREPDCAAQAHSNAERWKLIQRGSD